MNSLLKRLTICTTTNDCRYALMLFLIGVPLFFLELSLGQRFQQGAWGCFRAMHPALSGIGGASLVVRISDSVRVGVRVALWVVVRVVVEFYEW